MRMEPEKKKRAESGMMVVEAVLCFTVFVMVVIALIYMVNIFILHNKVQFAINSAAHEIASYSYLYAALGISSAENTVEKDGEKYTTPINDTANQVVQTWNKIEGLSKEFGGVVQSVGSMEMEASSIQSTMKEMEKLKGDAVETADSVKTSGTMLKNLFSDPKKMLVGMIYIGAYELGYEAKSLIGRAAAEGLAEKYLEQGELSASEYLVSYGVAEGYKGLNFDGTTLFCENDKGAGRLVDIVVSYDVDLGFLALIVPNGAKLHVVQRASVAGWVDGDGETLKKYGITKK